jgi:hypothetical protein
MHPGGVLLSDIAALLVINTVQFARISLQPQCLVAAEFGDAFANAEGEAVRTKGGGCVSVILR